MQKALVVIGITVLLLGLLWPWLGRIPLGRLPGDIMISRPNFRLYIPITTMVLISVVVSVVLWLLKK